MADLSLIRQADLVLSKCGRPQVPKGVVCVPIPKKYFYQKYFVNPDTVPPYPPDTNEPIEIAADTTFMLKALSGMVYGGVLVPASAAPLLSWGAVYLQIQYPSGRMLQNVLTDAQPYTGFGSNRMVFDKPIPCPAGSKLFVTVDDSISGFTGALGNFTVMLLFEGALHYFLKPSASTPPVAANPTDSAAALPRYYFRSPNQNILAPEWMVSGLDGVQCHRETPQGLEDDAFTYSNSQQPAVFDEASPVATTIRIQVGSDADFLCRRIMFQTLAGDIAPTFYGRIRTALGGSEFTNDYVPLNNHRIHRDWFLRRGIQVYIDVFGTPNGGGSDTTLYVYLEGAKRRGSIAA